MINENNLKEYSDKILSKLPDNLAEAVQKVNILNYENKIAAFDMAGTLMNGDLGHAVFCYMLANGYQLSIKWSEFNNLLKEGKSKEAKLRMTQAFTGLNARSVINAARSLLNSKSSEIVFNEDGIEYTYPIPKANTSMVNLITYLKINGWKVAIISATVHSIVREFNDLALKLNPAYVRGSKLVFDVTENYEDIFTEKLNGEIVNQQIKVETFKSFFGDTKPLIAGGDTTGDLELLNSTHNDGCAIICGPNIEHINELKSKLSTNLNKVDYIYD